MARQDFLAFLPKHPRKPGEVIRLARTAAGWTQSGLGRRCGCSASQISRWETGKSPLRDITLLRMLAAALDLPVGVFGLVPDAPTGVSTRSGSKSGLSVGRVPVPMREEDDPMRRRTLLTGVGGLAGTVLIGTAGADPARALEPALLSPPITTEAPLTPAQLGRAVSTARAVFGQARYAEVAALVPQLLSRAMATRAALRTPEDLGTVNRLIAELYTLTTDLMIKTGDDRLAWTAADRAVQAADASGDLLTQATTRRSWGIVLRRSGRADTARQLVVGTAAALQPELRRGPAYLSVYGSLLQTAAYTAAVDGDRETARTLISEAADAAERIGSHSTTFNTTAVGLYQISIARVLGDSGAAIEHARRIDPAAIPVVERRARYYSDIARSFHQWGKPEH